MKNNVDPAVRATVKDFADRLRGLSISPTMMEIQIAVAVERLREEHGIEVSEKRLARMAGVR